MSAKELLKLIENVDPEDSDALDEIDARWWFMLHSDDLQYYDGLADYLDGVKEGERGGSKGLRKIHPEYTLK